LGRAIARGGPPGFPRRPDLPKLNPMEAAIGFGQKDISRDVRKFPVASVYAALQLDRFSFRLWRMWQAADSGF
jgi:hypothetical protein